MAALRLTERNVFGFKAKAANLELAMGYATRPDGLVEIYCHERIGTQTYTLWRSFTTGPESALAAAENLCADAEDYLMLTRGPQRPYEDLDWEDFLEHLELAITNSFHWHAD